MVNLKRFSIVLLLFLIMQGLDAQDSVNYKRSIILQSSFSGNKQFLVVHTNNDKTLSQMQNANNMFFVDGKLTLNGQLKDHFEKVEFLSNEEFILKYPKY